MNDSLSGDAGTIDLSDDCACDDVDMPEQEVDLPGSEAGVDTTVIDVDDPSATVDVSSIVADPAASTVVGNPEVDTMYHLWQGESDGTCAPTSVAMVLSEQIGIPFASNEAVVERAVEMGLMRYDPNDPALADSGGYAGMDGPGMEQLLESYGVEADLTHGTIDDLAGVLGEGRSVMVAVDSSELWDRVGDDAAEGAQPDHAVVVTGIDTANGLVYMNDPAQADGSIVMTVDEFSEAWNDSGNEMISTRLPSEPAAAEAAEQATTLAAAGYVDGPTLLPFTLRPTSTTPLI